jgi:hypothetical protein
MLNYTNTSNGSTDSVREQQTESGNEWFLSVTRNRDNRMTSVPTVTQDTRYGTHFRQRHPSSSSTDPFRNTFPNLACLDARCNKLIPRYVADDASEMPPAVSLSFFFLGALKHRYSIAVTRLVSWRVRLTPSSSLCRSPSAPGRR